MISKKMKAQIEGGSAIRALFEEGKIMADKYGAENVCDFSLGNPNLPPPESFKNAVISVLNEEEPVYVHGYMNNGGYESVRAAIAASINKRFGTAFGVKNIIMSVGAAGGINATLKTLLDPGDEVVVFAPFFGEYRAYTANYDGILVEVPANPPTFQPDIAGLEKALSPRTKAVIVNTPNNPTGVVYTEESVIAIADTLRNKEAEYGTSIYLIADEPYRELVYDSDIVVPYLTKYYKNTIVGYSFSKSLSLPGERIGYVVIPDEADDYKDLFDGIVTATRISGFVNAPSLVQLAVKKCLDEQADIEFYGRNRDLLYNGLTDAGYECVKPDGAFYLWVKTPVEEAEFINICKEHMMVVVPGSSFGGPGYVRLAYCISPDVIKKSIPRFKEIIKEIKK